MTIAPAPKGWCPTLLAPMASGDGWLVRIKPTAASLSAAAARLIAGAARAHGNGHIDLTALGNLQLRGLTPESAAAAAERIIAAGLANPDPSIEMVRNVMASPLGRDDPTSAFDAHALAAEIEAMLAAERALHALPAKFGFLVDGGGTLPLTGITADIMLRAHVDRLTLRIDGGALAATCPASEAVASVKAVALAFLALATQRHEQPGRMRALVMAVGEAPIFAAACLAPLPSPRPAPAAASPIGFIPSPAQDTGAFGAGLPFGRIAADALSALAGLSEKFGDGTLRTTPWRVLLLPGVQSSDATRLAEHIRALGLITDPTDPRLNIFACVGAPSCTSASVATRADAARLAALVRPGLTLHVSGCAKGCAHAGPAAITLIGRDGRYDLVRDGRAGDTPTRTGLSLEQIIAALRAEQEVIA
jgi:precorrin-3B synthase